MNFVEIAPPYAGTIFGITNSLANISGFAAPYVVGVLLQGKVNTFSSCRIVYITFVNLLLCKMCVELR